MNQSFFIHEAGEADVPVLARLIRDAFRDVAVRFALTPENCPKHPSNCTDAWIETDLARGVRYFMLSQAGEPVGCAGLERPNPSVCYLTRLSVLPARRRRGFGRALAEHVLTLARNGGAEKAGIGIIADQTDLARWYSGLGFVDTGTKRFEHLPFVVRFMECPLSSYEGPIA
jgi:GNAT superfamily N-acetyltransferase